jgi:two-component system, OmpR family, response regulator ChvI
MPDNSTGRAVVIEDDDDIRLLISTVLEQRGLDVRAAASGLAGLALVQEHQPDLVTLDLGLPDIEGFEVCRRLRTISDAYVVMVSASGDEVDQLLGLEIGADDYITKPFSQRLLLERIRALLRRNETSRAEGSGATPAGVMTRGDLVLDETKHQCTWRGTPIQLTVTEFLLLKALATRPGMVKSRDQLIDAAYGENIYVDDRTIDSHIKRVRKKFRATDDTFNFIETLYGIGYRYREA